MRIPGYCMRCGKFKHVTSRPGFMSRDVPVGVCDECDEEEQQ